MGCDAPMQKDGALCVGQKTLSTACGRALHTTHERAAVAPWRWRHDLHNRWSAWGVEISFIFMIVFPGRRTGCDVRPRAISSDQRP
jgi:hypothetical protein